MNEMKNACENTEKELAILQEQRARKIGHFCFSCSDILTWRHTSNRCKKCYEINRNKTRLSDRAVIKNHPNYVVTNLRKKLHTVRVRLSRLIVKSDLAKKELSMVFKDSSITTKLLKRVFQHTNLNKQQFTNS